MASVSYSLTAAVAQEGDDPENITLGTSGPGAGDVELRVNTANIATLKDLNVALCQMLIRINDSRYGHADFGLI
jgi:hypothetical protein